MLEALASALGVPAAWLHGDPKHMELLIEGDGDGETTQSGNVDPVTERILLWSREERELYVLADLHINVRRSQVAAGRGSQPPQPCQAGEATHRAVAVAAPRPLRAAFGLRELVRYA